MSEAEFQRYICDACGFIYDEAQGDPDSGLAPGTRYEAIPDDWQCPLCGLSKSDLRLIPDMPAVATKPASAYPKASGGKCRGGSDYIVIVGAGIAGWSVAESIRREDADTPVLLVSACAGISYPKPALSTALANGRNAEDLAENDAVSKAAELGLEVRPETRIIKIDTKKQRLVTSKGGIQYGRLVLALGAHQRALPIDGDAQDAVLRVNDLAAYQKMRARLDKGVRHVTVLGAGLIGCEFAEDLRGAGFQVSVVDPADYPLASLLPYEPGQTLRARLQEKGVDWHFGTTLDRIENNGGRKRATLSGGETFETDLVLSAAGLLANTELAEKAGLEVNCGISTNCLMRASIEGIYAIGDCASVEGQVFAYIEPILRQAETIAADLRGDSLPFEMRSPLVRVKTPSFPLVICPPGKEVDEIDASPTDREPGRIDYLRGDRVVGFIISGDMAAQGSSLYRELIA